MVLVESGEEKHFILFDRAADGAPRLLLAIVRPEGEEGIGSSERTVAEKVESGAVPVIRSRFSNDVDNSSASAPEFSSVSIGRDAKFLHDFGRKLVGSAVASARLREKGIVEVAAVHQKAVLESAQS